jgi:acyl-[acyl carrier protein]--UDP-N-acetylglucosamine O-acyltransferase
MLYDKRLNTSQAVEKIKQEITDSIEVKNLIQFIESTQRGIIR